MATRTNEERARDEELAEQALLGKLLPAHDLRRHIKVVGVTFKNADGGSRQEAIEEMRQFEPLELERDPEDRFDFNCVKVIAKVDGDRVQIGTVDSDTARYLAPRMDGGEAWAGIATRVGGKISKGVGALLYRSASTQYTVPGTQLVQEQGEQVSAVSSQLSEGQEQDQQQEQEQPQRPDPEAVRRLAFELYEARGRHHGYDGHDWRLAERLLAG